MTSPYLITFTPTGKFFFGSSQSYGESFHVISLLFPPATTILGCLRRTMLYNGGWLADKGNFPDETKKISYEPVTGKSAFADLSGENKDDDDFGSIKRISPVFIVRQDKGHLCADDFLFPIPKDVYFTYKENDPLKEINGLRVLDFENNAVGISSRSDSEKAIYKTSKKTKDEPAGYLGGVQFWESYCNGERLHYNSDHRLSEIFHDIQQYGIARETRKTKDKAFYLEKSFRMKNGYSFGVIVHLEDSHNLKDDKVFLGGGRNLFFMKIKRLPASNPERYNVHPIVKRLLQITDNGDFKGSPAKFNEDIKLVLISPFFGDGEINGLSHSIIPGLSAQRMLGQTAIKSDAYRMYPPGCVLIPEKGKKIKINKVFKVPAKIGYNWTLKAKRK